MSPRMIWIHQLQTLQTRLLSETEWKDKNSKIKVEQNFWWCPTATQAEGLKSAPTANTVVTISSKPQHKGREFIPLTPRSDLDAIYSRNLSHAQCSPMHMLESRFFCVATGEKAAGFLQRPYSLPSVPHHHSHESPRSCFVSSDHLKGKNHRIAWVGRDLKPSSCCGQGCQPLNHWLHQVDQSPSNLALKKPSSTYWDVHLSWLVELSSSSEEMWPAGTERRLSLSTLPL